MATRLYLGAAATTVPISPTPIAGWDSTSILERRMTGTTGVAEALQLVRFSHDGDLSYRDILYRQYITKSLVAGQTISASQAFKAQVRARHEDGGLSSTYVSLALRVINVSTVKKTLIPLTLDDVSASTGVYYNRQVTGTTASGAYTTVAGDRLVLEIGMSGGPKGASTASELILGYSVTGWLPEDDTSQAALSPWFELSDTLTFGEVLTAESGTFTLTGKDAQLTAGRLPLSADAGAFTVTGQDATLTVGHGLDAAVGAFTVAGQSAGLLATRLLDAAAGAFVLTGQDASFVYGRFVDAEAGAFVLDGQDASFVIAKGIEGGTGEFTLAGQAATLTYSGDLPPATLPHFGDTLMWLMIDEPGGGW